MGDANFPSSIDDRKCRSSSAKVISIISLLTGRSLKTAFSNYDHNFKYRVGKTVKPTEHFNKSMEPCASGIHWFLSKQDAHSWY